MMIVVIMAMNFMMMTIMLLNTASRPYPPTTTATTGAKAHKDKPLATSTLPNPILGNLGTGEMIWKEGR